MKRRGFLQNIGYLGLILFLGFLSAAASPGPETLVTSTSEKIKPKTDPSGRGTQGPGPVANLREAQVLLADYEEALPRAKAARGPTLAELARLCYILGEWGEWEEKGDRRKYFEKGRDYAEFLCREQPRRVEGHYWLARNLCGLARMSGAKQALESVTVIAQELKVAERLNGAYNQAGPLRVLGRLYHKAPAWPLSVGDLQKAVQMLRAAVKFAPENSTNHLYLAEVLIDLGQPNQACQELQKALKATTRANWAPGLQDEHQEAQQLLKQCTPKPNPYAFKD